MKNSKAFLFGLLTVIISMLDATETSAQTIRHFVWKTTIPAFINGQLDSAPLTNLTNYNIDVPKPSCPNSSAKFCEVEVGYSSGTPTNQGIVNALRAKYITQGFFTDGQVFFATVDGVSVTFTVQLKP